LQSHLSVHITAKIFLLAAVVILASLPLLAAGCSQSGSQQSILNIGVILGTGGLGDKSFNDSAYSGLLQAQKQYNIRFETIAPSGKEADLNALRLFARNNFDLIIGVAFENMDNIRTVAAEFPSARFAAVDFELSGGNIASIVYREQEADFLMGVLAALLTRTRYVGVIGGTDIPAIRRIMSGFKQGVTYQDTRVRTFQDFAGTFSDPQAGYKLALERYNQGADVIHNAASRTGLGIIEAAKEVDKLTTGTSGDQRYLAPGNMVGNRPKRVDTAVLLLIGEVKDGKFKPGVRSLGLKENGISLGPFDESRVSTGMLARLEDLKQKIIDGRITIQVE
jgi:basic membrane protein A and related proteins